MDSISQNLQGKMNSSQWSIEFVWKSQKSVALMIQGCFASSNLKNSEFKPIMHRG